MKPEARWLGDRQSVEVPVDIAVMAHKGTTVSFLVNCTLAPTSVAAAAAATQLSYFPDAKYVSAYDEPNKKIGLQTQSLRKAAIFSDV
jgi:hypothetical protein